MRLRLSYYIIFIVLQREQQVYILPEQITVLTEDMDSAMARDDSINRIVQIESLFTKFPSQQTNSHLRYVTLLWAVGWSSALVGWPWHSNGQVPNMISDYFIMLRVVLLQRPTTAYSFAAGGTAGGLSLVDACFGPEFLTGGGNMGCGNLGYAPQHCIQ